MFVSTSLTPRFQVIFWLSTKFAILLWTHGIFWKMTDVKCFCFWHQSTYLMVQFKANASIVTKLIVSKNTIIFNFALCSFLFIFYLVSLLGGHISRNRLRSQRRLRRFIEYFTSIFVLRLCSSFVSIDVKTYKIFWTGFNDRFHSLHMDEWMKINLFKDFRWHLMAFIIHKNIYELFNFAVFQFWFICYRLSLKTDLVFLLNYKSTCIA